MLLIKHTAVLRKNHSLNKNNLTNKPDFFVPENKEVRLQLFIKIPP